jgi:TPR repeat protein
LGLQRNNAKARDYFYLAAHNHNNRDAEVALGSLVAYDDPVGSPYDKKRWYNLARHADMGFPNFQLGSLYFHGLFGQPEFQAAIDHYEIARTNNFVGASNALGMIYESGLGVHTDTKLAAQYYTLDAKKNYGDAIYNLGRLYLEGRGISQNKDLAYALFRYAYSKHRHPMSLRILEEHGALDLPVKFNVEQFLGIRGH